MRRTAGAIAALLLLVGAQPNATLEARVSRLEVQNVDLQARVAVLEAIVLPAPTTSATPTPSSLQSAGPTPSPVSSGTVVPASSGALAAAVANARSGDTLLLRGGDHVLAGILSTSKSLTIQNYPGETPVVTQGPNTRQDGLYLTGGPDIVRGITFRAGSGTFHDSMGSALSEVDGGHDVLYEDVTFIGGPTLDEHQQLLYARYAHNVTCRRCTFIGNGTAGFGVHNYPGLANSNPVVIVEDSRFLQIGYAITSDWPITVRRSYFEDVTLAVQLRNYAGQAGGSSVTDNRGVRVVTPIQNPSMATTNSGNVWQ